MPISLPEEVAFIGALALLVHTPRATKRLVNTYQLVRGDGRRRTRQFGCEGL
jgi:hypothetical protein